MTYHLRSMYAKIKCWVWIALSLWINKPSVSKYRHVQSLKGDNDWTLWTSLFILWTSRPYIIMALLYLTLVYHLHGNCANNMFLNKMLMTYERPSQVTTPTVLGSDHSPSNVCNNPLFVNDRFGTQKLLSSPYVVVHIQHMDDNYKYEKLHPNPVDKVLLNIMTNHCAVINVQRWAIQPFFSIVMYEFRRHLVRANTKT